MKKGLLKVSLVLFAGSLLAGLVFGDWFSKLRLNFLIARQQARELEEAKRLEKVFNQAPQVKVIPSK